MKLLGRSQSINCNLSSWLFQWKNIRNVCMKQLSPSLQNRTVTLKRHGVTELIPLSPFLALLKTTLVMDALLKLDSYIKYLYMK